MPRLGLDWSRRGFLREVVYLILDGALVHEITADISAPCTLGKTMTEITLPPPPLCPPPDHVDANHNAKLTNGATDSPPPYPPHGDIEASDATRNVQTLPSLPAREDSMVPVQDVSAVPARSEGRDAKGRFAPGNSGRPKGARSRLISELEQAMELAAPEIVRILIARAQCGDGSMEAAKYILERIAPSRRGRLVEIEGFEVRTPADVPAALASLASAVGDGTITIDEATAIGGLLQRFLDTFETAHRLAKSLDPAAL